MVQTPPVEKPAFDSLKGEHRSPQERPALLVGDLVVSLVDSEFVPVLPGWSYRRWWQVLQYPDLGDRAQAATREIGRHRDQVLGHPEVRALVEWAGRRHRRDPSAGAAAALVMLRAVQVGTLDLRCDTEAMAKVLADAVDRAVSPRVSVRHRELPLLSPERVVAAADDEPPAEHPRLVAVVDGLLRLAGTDRSAVLAERVVGAVVQAAEWWAAHAVAVPTVVDGPTLPGIVPAQDLRPSERLPQALRDVDLLGLVAGPHPGRGRPCQVAWRRGLTYWTAACLAQVTSDLPPSATVRWWRTQLSVLDTGGTEPATASLLRTQLHGAV